MKHSLCESEAASAAHLSMPQSEHAGSGEANGDECWICLDGPGRNGSSLKSLCSCSMRKAHAICQMRWHMSQLQRGASTACRFCGQGNWESTFGKLPRAQPTVKVEFGNRSAALVSMAPGARGMRDFQEAVRRQYNIHPDEELVVSFRSCEPPLPAADAAPPPNRQRCAVGLDGWETYDTVVLLAQMQAAARAAAAPLPPVVLPPAQAAARNVAPMAHVEATAADTSPTAAAAVANLGLQLPVEHGAALAGDDVDDMDSGPPASLMSAAHHAVELSDELIAASA